MGRRGSDTATGSVGELCQWTNSSLTCILHAYCVTSKYLKAKVFSSFKILQFSGTVYLAGRILAIFSYSHLMNNIVLASRRGLTSC